MSKSNADLKRGDRVRGREQNCGNGDKYRYGESAVYTIEYISDKHVIYHWQSKKGPIRQGEVYDTRSNFDEQYEPYVEEFEVGKTYRRKTSESDTTFKVVHVDPSGAVCVLVTPGNHGGAPFGDGTQQSYRYLYEEVPEDEA
jgi:hypothetical protein